MRIQVLATADAGNSKFPYVRGTAAVSQPNVRWKPGGNGHREGKAVRFRDLPHATQPTKPRFPAGKQHRFVHFANR